MTDKAKDFSRYAYFVSRGKNYAICLKPDRKKIVDGEVEFATGIRIEFNNGMLRLDRELKTDNEKIKFLRDRIEKEKNAGQVKRTIWEEEAPQKTYTEDEVKEILKNKKGPDPAGNVNVNNNLPVV